MKKDHDMTDAKALRETSMNNSTDAVSEGNWRQDLLDLEELAEHASEPLSQRLLTVIDAARFEAQTRAGGELEYIFADTLHTSPKLSCDDRVALLREFQSRLSLPQPTSDTEGANEGCASCKGMIGDLAPGREPEELCDTCYHDALSQPASDTEGGQKVPLGPVQRCPACHTKFQQVFDVDAHIGSLPTPNTERERGGDDWLDNLVDENQLLMPQAREIAERMFDQSTQTRQWFAARNAALVALTTTDTAALVEALRCRLRDIDGEDEGWTDAGMEDAFFRWPVIERELLTALRSTPKQEADRG